MGLGVVCVRDGCLGEVFECLAEPELVGDGPSDNRARAEMHPSMSQSNAVLGSRSEPLSKRGMCVTKVMDSGRTDGGYVWGNACGRLMVPNGEGL